MVIYCPSALGSCRTCSCINPPAFNDWWSLRYTKGTTKSEHKNCVAREDIGTHNSVTDYETHSNCVATEDNETQADKEPQDDTGALQVVLMLPGHLTRWYAKGTSKGTTIWYSAAEVTTNGTVNEGDNQGDN